MLKLLIHFAAGAVCLGWYAVVQYRLLPGMSETSTFMGMLARFLAFGPAVIFGMWYMNGQITSGIGTAVFLAGAFGMHELTRRVWQTKS